MRSFLFFILLFILKIGNSQTAKNEIVIGISSNYYFDKLKFKVNENYLPSKIQFYRRFNEKYTWSVDINHYYQQNAIELTKIGFETGDVISRWHINSIARINYNFLQWKRFYINVGIGANVGILSELIHFLAIYNTNGVLVDQKTYGLGSITYGPSVNLNAKLYFLKKFLVSTDLMFSRYFNTNSNNNLEFTFSLSILVVFLKSISVSTCGVAAFSRHVRHVHCCALAFFFYIEAFSGLINSSLLITIFFFSNFMFSAITSNSNIKS